MSQHDYDIANGSGASVRADINLALNAIRSCNSGASAPTSTVAGMLWYDTINGILKQRNSANTAWVTAAELISGGGQSAGLRNKIINGKMDVAQRGTSFAPIANDAYSLDRFLCRYISSAVATVSQQADVPSSNEFQNSLRVAVTTADTSIATGDLFHITQCIEGYNARDFIGRTFTLSFWVRSSKTGVHCVSFRNSNTDRSYVAEYTVITANTWEQKSITVSGGLITAGSWNWTNGAGIYVGWALAAGATYQVTKDAWQTGSFLSTSSQVNCLDTIGNIFAITGVQLEIGSEATPFEHRSHGIELALCQRYYGVVTTQITNIATSPAKGVFFKSSMRIAPTIAGGGAGFSSVITTEAADCGQTTAAYQTLTFNSEF